MIISFRHKGLKNLSEDGDTRKVQQSLVPRISDVLAALDIVDELNELDRPGWRLHALRGNLAGHWSISVSGNWRITFRFEDRNVYDVDLVDYH